MVSLLLWLGKWLIIIYKFEVRIGLSISRPGDLDFLTLKLVRIIARGVDNLLTNFGVSRSFYSRLIGQHLSDASRDLATLTCDLLISE